LIRRPPGTTRVRSSAASDVYKRQVQVGVVHPDQGDGPAVGHDVVAPVGQVAPAGAAQGRRHLLEGQRLLPGRVAVPRVVGEVAGRVLRDRRVVVCLLYTSDAADDLTRVDL